MLYKLRKNRCNKQTLLSLYHSLFQSHLTYGLCVWGNAESNYLQKIILTQKRAIRAISGLGFGESTVEAFHNLKILKFADLFSFQYASLMWDYEHNSMPQRLSNLFHKISDVHSYGTRSSSKQKLSENIVINTNAHGKQC